MRWVWICGLFSLALTAQDQPLLRVNTRLVEVDVVVTDKNGPVQGLTQDDFTVFDEGKRQKIAVFSVRSAGTAGAGTGLPIPAGAVTNRVSGSGVTAVLFDMLNTADQVAGAPAAPQAYARVQLLKYLRTVETSNEESYAIFSLLKRIKVVQDFTRDSQLILQAATKMLPEHSADQGAEDLAAELLASAPDLHDPIANSMQQNSIKEMRDFSEKNRALITAQALESIARHLQGIPGRKKLVWVSASFPASTMDVRSRNGRALIENQEFGREIQHAVRALNDANVAVYPIDPRDPYDAGLTADGIDTMNLFAHGTGGKAFDSLTDLAGAIDSAVKDTNLSYTLGFYPRDVTLDGKYHTLSVSVARKGIEVRARRGYYADGPKTLTEKQKQDSMREVLASPLNATELGLSARTLPARDRAGAYDIELAFDVHEVHLERQGDLWVALLELITYLPSAAKPNARKEAITISLTEARLREVLAANAYIVRRPLGLTVAKPGTLKVALEDQVTGAKGSVELRVGGG